jgi:hypothetical protein
MAFVSGRISCFLRNPNGDLRGMLLANGCEIRFPVALRPLVLPIVKVGSFVGVKGTLCADGIADGYMEATVVTNLNSYLSANLPTPNPEGKPGMRFTTPTETASLAHHESTRTELGKVVENQVPHLDDASQGDLNDASTQTLPPGSYFHSLVLAKDEKDAELKRNETAHSIGLAYDSLHRIQAILAYLHIMKHRVPGISQFLDEAKHTYVQALGRFSTQDFAASKEFAEASISLSRVVEIVMSRTLRADTTLPSLVPPPPEQLETASVPEHVEEDLAHAETVLCRIHWVLENGTLPSEDRAQVRKIASWGDAFYKQAQHTYREAVLEDAGEFAQAALAGAFSAEHVCRKWYVSHPVNHDQ